MIDYYFDDEVQIPIQIIVAHSAELEESFVNSPILVLIGKLLQQKLEHLVPVLVVIEDGFHEVQTVSESLHGEINYVIIMLFPRTQDDGSQELFTSFRIDFAVGIIKHFANISNCQNRGFSDFEIRVDGIIGQRIHNLQPLSSGNLNACNNSDNIGSCFHDYIFWAHEKLQSSVLDNVLQVD